MVCIAAAAAAADAKGKRGIAASAPHYGAAIAGGDPPSARPTMEEEESFTAILFPFAEYFSRWSRNREMAQCTQSGSCETPLKF